MIKRILVALDPDEDTPVAIHYAIRLAKRFNAELAGLAVVDVSNINKVIGVTGYGSEVTGREIWAEMAEGTKQIAEMLLETFKKEVEKAGVRHRDIKRRGASAEMIVEEMKYYDLLVLGRDSRFFYSEPEKDTKTLAKVVKKGITPTLIVTDEYREVESIMVAFDGSNASIRTLKGFVHLLPYGKGIDIELVNIADGNSIEAIDKSSSLLKMAEGYLKAHNFDYVFKTVLEKGSPGQRILDLQLEKNPDLILLGAHSVSAVKRATFGSTTHYMIENTVPPLVFSTIISK